MCIRDSPWGKHRENPHPVKQTFHDWYKKNRAPGQTDAAETAK